MKLENLISGILYIYLVFFPFKLFSQQDTVKQPVIIPPKLAIKLSVLSYFDITPSYQIALEYQISPKYHLQNEIGYITTLGTPYYQEGNSISGIRLRNELRYYKRKNKYNEFYYISPELLFKYFNEKVEKTYLRYNGAYSEKINKKLTRVVVATHIKIGTISKLFNSRFYTDFSCGIGLRYSKQVTADLPDDAEIFEFTYDRKDGELVMPSLVFGLKIGYIIR